LAKEIEREKSRKFENIDAPDIGDLVEAHGLADELEIVKDGLEAQLRDLEHKKLNLDKEMRFLCDQIKIWKDRSGGNCPACKQEIDQHYTLKFVNEYGEKLKTKYELAVLIDSKIKTLKKKLESIIINRPPISLVEARTLDSMNDRMKGLRAAARATVQENKYRIEQLEKEIEHVQEDISCTEKLINKPAIPLADARAIHVEYKHLLKEIDKLKNDYDSIKARVNPYEVLVSDLQETIRGLDEDIKRGENVVKQLDVLFSHYKYIWRSYSDRRKIKKWLLAELIPFLNSRIDYYLDAFDIELNIKFTSTLSNETDKWGYEFCSAGERKRIDLCIMFALYDLYMSIYGRQCNIMVLDEVDSRLDQDGVQAFSDIIINDFSKENDTLKPDTIFVVSHKPELKDIFPEQILLEKENSFSRIVVSS